MKKIQVKKNIIDKVVSYISPEAGMQRLHNRARMAIAGSYVGARSNRRQTKAWSTSEGSANADILPDLPELRERSRDLVRNAPLANGAINTTVTNVIGTGLKAQSRIPRNILMGIIGNNEEDIDAWERKAEMLFNNWATSKDCDATRTQTFKQMQSLVFRSALENGDSFILRRFINRGQKLGTSLLVLESDRIQNENQKADTREMAGGVEMDKYGAPIAYHITKTHPGDDYDRDITTVRYKAFDKNGNRQVYHVFKKDRAGQVRGVPYLAPVIEPLKMLDRYTEAEVMAAVISGMFTVFVKTEDSGGLQPFQPTSEAEKAPSDDLALGNGIVTELMPNESIETANPGRPNNAFDPFVQSVLRQIGVALELPFEVLIKHFTASYSAAQAAILESWKFFSTRRQWMVEDFCQPVYEAVIAEAVANGFLEAPGFFENEDLRRAYTSAEWIGMPRGQIDQLKEINAAEKRLSLGITTLAEETAQLTGKDWEKNHVQSVKEHNIRMESGLINDQVQQVQGGNFED